MSNAFSHYWTEKENEKSAGLPLQHVASNDFVKRGVKPGDSIFCFTQHDGQLFLIARMKVDWVTDSMRAVEFLGCPINFADREDHCVCTPQNGSLIIFNRKLPVSLVTQLQFTTGGGSITGVALTPSGGVDRQAMRTVRRLTPESASLLDALIDGGE